MGLLDHNRDAVPATATGLPSLFTGLLARESPQERAVAASREAARLWRMAGKPDLADAIERVLKAHEPGRPGPKDEWTDTDRLSLARDFISLWRRKPALSVLNSCIILAGREPWRSKQMRRGPVTSEAVRQQLIAFLRTVRLTPARFKRALHRHDQASTTLDDSLKDSGSITSEHM
jgi:hypothetical protein